MDLFIQISGWIGMVFVVLAYYLISHNKVNSSSKYYQILNLLGAIGVGINVFFQHAWSALALQIIWGIIAIASIIKFKNFKIK